MSVKGQKRDPLGHSTAAWDKHVYCPSCRDKGKGTDPCVVDETNDCEICLSFTEAQWQQIFERRTYHSKRYNRVNSDSNVQPQTGSSESGDSQYKLKSCVSVVSPKNAVTSGHSNNPDEHYMSGNEYLSRKSGQMNETSRSGQNLSGGTSRSSRQTGQNTSTEASRMSRQSGHYVSGDTQPTDQNPSGQTEHFVSRDKLITVISQNSPTGQDKLDNKSMSGHSYNEEEKDCVNDKSHKKRKKHKKHKKSKKACREDDLDSREFDQPSGVVSSPTQSISGDNKLHTSHVSNLFGTQNQT